MIFSFHRIWNTIIWAASAVSQTIKICTWFENYLLRSMKSAIRNNACLLHWQDLTKFSSTRTVGEPHYCLHRVFITHWPSPSHHCDRGRASRRGRTSPWLEAQPAHTYIIIDCQYKDGRGGIHARVCICVRRGVVSPWRKLLIEVEMIKSDTKEYTVDNNVQ